MKSKILYHLTLLVLILNTSKSLSQNEFILTWKTDIVDSNDSTILIPTAPSTTYSYDVDWDNDGNYNFTDLGYSAGSLYHDFGTPGTYTIRIRGAFPRIYFNNLSNSNKLKLIAIEQWGNIQWSSMERAFFGCSNLVINATDSPDLSNVTSMQLMFALCSSLNQNIGFWDTSSVTNMNSLFSQATNFNQDISSWNTANVTDMTSMFFLASNFNQNISSWNTGNVISMENLFRSASNFDQDLSAWNIENLINANYMFKDIQLSDINYEALLISWASQNVKTNINFDGGNSKYCSQAALNAKNTLINSKNWTIVDGGACSTLNTDKIELQEFSIYPNPASEYIEINDLNKEAIISILDLKGNKILTQKTYIKSPKININNIANGIYILDIKTKEKNISIKLIKN